MAVLATFLLLFFLDLFTGVIFYGTGKLLLHPFRKNSSTKESPQQRWLNVLVGLIAVMSVLYGLSHL
jgi:hypothetical protein